MADLDMPVAFPGRFQPRQRHRGQTSISRDLFERGETPLDAPAPWKQARERFRSPSPIGSDGSRSPHGLRLQESNASDLSMKDASEKSEAWGFPAKVACHVLGVLVAFYVFQLSRTFHEQRWHDELVSICEDRGRLIEGMFKTNCDHVRTFQMFMTTLNSSAHCPSCDMITETLSGPMTCRLNTVPRVSEDLANDFLEKTMFARPWSHRIGYVAVVRRRDRSTFEKCMGLTIVDWHTREPAKDNPVFMVKTHGANVTFLDGIDMLSISDFHFNLLTRVRSAEGLTMSAPYPLMTSKEKRLGVGVVLPVRTVPLPPGSSAAERERSTDGCIMTTIDFESSVDQELAELNPMGDDEVDIRVDDITDPSEPIPLYEPEHGDPAATAGRGELKPPGYLASDGDVHVPYWGAKSAAASTSMTGQWITVPLDLGDVDRRHTMKCKWKVKKPIPAIAIVLGCGVLAIYALLSQVIHQALLSFSKMKEDFGRMAALKQAADAGNRAKSAFLAAMTNEVRTPMNGVLGMINLLLRTNLDPVQQDYARTAEASGKALIYLINDVLDFANIESGNLELENIAFNLRVLIDEILTAQAPLVHEKKGGLEVASLVFDSVPQTVIGDAARVRQLISSIVGNAVKFTQSGHVLLTVTEDRSDSRRSGSNWFPRSSAQPRKSGASSPETSPTSSPFHSQEFRSAPVRQPPVSYSTAEHPTLSGRETADGTCSWPVVYKMLQDDEVKLAMCNSAQKASRGGSGGLVPVRKKVKLLFRVEDTGIGIPDEAKASIFQPFSSLAGQAQSLYGGTGIGLALAQRLAHLMGGEIDFVSHEGVGSTFSFSLVLDVLDKPQGGDHVPWTSLPRAKWTNPSLPTIQGKKALVVDGRPLRQQVLASYLRRLGCQVDVCENIFGAVVAVQDFYLQRIRTDKAGEAGSAHSSGEVDTIVAGPGAGSGAKDEDSEGAPWWDVVLVDADAGGVGNGHEFGRLVMRAGEVKAAMRAGYALPKMVLLTPCPLNEQETEQAKSNFFAATLPKPLRATPLAACLQEVLQLEPLANGPSSQGHRQQLADVLKGKRLLVVDGNALNRKVASATMLKLGAEAVVSVSSGPEALRSLRPPHDFHCMLLDINSEGYDTARKIRTMEDRYAMSQSPPSSPSTMEDTDTSGDLHVERIPIIGLTADMSQGGWLECERAGMNAYITKPIEEAALIDALLSALGVKITSGSQGSSSGSQPQPKPFGHVPEQAPPQGLGAKGAPGGQGYSGGGHLSSGPTSRGGQMPSPSLRNWLGETGSAIHGL